ncbi:MAG: MnhB domain-containing protein [Chloroflexota bacterium]
MNPRQRGWFFGLSLAAFVGLLLWGVLGLPPLGHYRGPYGDAINHAVVAQRHATDAISAVNFDYRGVDTIVEEFILFASVAGCTLLLRQQRDEQENTARTQMMEGRMGQTSAAVAALGLTLGVPVSLLGWYVVTHGQLTPGGGFQGGVVMSSGAVFLYLAGEYVTLRRLNPPALLEVLEALGAGGYILIGFAGMATGAAFLQNVLPLGSVGQVNSAGTIWVISMSVGVEVAAAFVLLTTEFMEQALDVRQRRRA